jgi:uncharacterized protein (TIGR01777 family)
MQKPSCDSHAVLIILRHHKSTVQTGGGDTMRVLITGGTDSARLCHLLRKDNHEIVILSRDPHAQHTPAGVTVLHWDGCSANGWGDLIDANTAIINLADEHPVSWLWTPEQAEQVLEHRLCAAQAIAEAIYHAPYPPRLLLQESTIDYYGDCGDDLVIEDSPPGDGWRARLALELEQATLDIPVRQVWLRLGLVLDKKSLPGVLTSDSQWISWVHNDDVVRAIRFLLAREDVSGPVNIASPSPATAGCFRKLLTQLQPKKKLRAINDTMLESQRALPHKLTNMGFRFAFSDAEDALRMLFL